MRVGRGGGGLIEAGRPHTHTHTSIFVVTGKLEGGREERGCCVCLYVCEGGGECPTQEWEALTTQCLATHPVQEFLADPNVFPLNRECAAMAWEMYKAWDPATGASHPGEVRPGNRGCTSHPTPPPTRTCCHPSLAWVRVCRVLRPRGDLCLFLSPPPPSPTTRPLQAKLTPSSITIGTRNIKFDVFSTLPSSL
jgi:hypothetical protein